jgi:hypothetical protein
MDTTEAVTTAGQAPWPGLLYASWLPTRAGARTGR